MDVPPKTADLLIMRKTLSHAVVTKKFRRDRFPTAFDVVNDIQRLISIGGVGNDDLTGFGSRSDDTQRRISSRISPQAVDVPQVFAA